MEPYYIGLDLGTSGLKGLLVNGRGEIVKSCAVSYPVSYPRDGWSEQDPSDWLSAAERAIDELAEGVENAVEGVSIGGQMHGLVALDEHDRPIRPAILWNDGRAEEQARRLNTVPGRAELDRMTANIAYAGFTAPKILWMKENEPENFARIRRICLPKDYVAYKLTGEFTSDFSDASGTLLLDVKNRRYSDEMCDICSISRDFLPKLKESYEPTGRVKRLPKAMLAAGAGDNAAAAVGTGAVSAGDCNISLGTSGTVFIASDEFAPCADNALHSFCHADGKWHLMGCILSAAGANKWWIEDILRSNDYDLQAKELGTNKTFFLPYLMGERSPHNDANVRGAFVGLSAATTRADMSLAVLEGVAFALRDCLERARKCGVNVTETTVCGGGAKSELWKRILANVLNMEVVSPAVEQGPAYGAALLAMTACGRFRNVAETKQLIRMRERITPDRKISARYSEQYARYIRLYPALKDVLH